MLKIIFLLFLNLTSYAQEGEFHLFMKNFRGREVHVYLPQGYMDQSNSYPVLYMHDGQNLYDPSRAYNGQTWRAKETLNNLIRLKLIRPLIVVAIDNTQNRINEYTHDTDDEGRGGEANFYLNALVHELHPLIKKYLRILPGPENTGILGSSLGGLVSLYAGVSYPQIFGLVGALSPSLWWNEKSIYKIIDNANKLPNKLYMDSGTAGGERPRDVIELYSNLKDRYSSDSIYYWIKEGDDHSERAWANRFRVSLTYLFKPSKE